MYAYNRHECLKSTGTSFLQILYIANDFDSFVQIPYQLFNLKRALNSKNHFDLSTGGSFH